MYSEGTIKIILNISESVSPRNEAVLDSFWLGALPPGNGCQMRPLNSF